MSLPPVWACLGILARLDVWPQRGKGLCNLIIQACSVHTWRDHNEANTRCILYLQWGHINLFISHIYFAFPIPFPPLLPSTSLSSLNIV